MAASTILQRARTLAEQAAALRTVKNEITGHVQRKERWVEQGILEPIVKVLQTSRQGGTQEEQVRLQALQLLAIFATGGSSFLTPIHAAGAIPVILTNTIPSDNSSQVVLTALRALSNIAEASGLAASSPVSPASLADLIFTPLYLDAFHAILASDLTTSVAQEQKRLVASLISRLCREDKNQNALANHSILDALATMLASFVVARGEVVPGAEMLGQSDGLAEMIPAPAPPGSSLTAVLDAISTIIAESRFRACMLICSPAIMAVFPNAELSDPAKGTRAAWNAMEVAGLASYRAKNPGAVDHLLPIVPVHHPKRFTSQNAQFPPLGFSMSKESLAANGRSNPKGFSGWDSVRLEAAASNGEADGDEAESQLIPWLIHLVRSTIGLERVMAASVLASLFKAGFASPARETTMWCLVVPVLCQLIKETHQQEASLASTESVALDGKIASNWAILERTPTVVARLIAGSELLQKSAHDCGAIKTVCKLLAESYEPMTVQSSPRPWSPSADGMMEADNHHATSRMGQPGHLPLYTHRLRMRESALKLIAALISSKEEYRKAVVEQEVVPYIVESLSPFPTKPKQGKERSKPEKAEHAVQTSGPSPYGTNPNAVLIAACHVVRLLSRSVGILRTSLEDYGVTGSIFRLLRHSDKEVQVAACGALCNLVLQVSPMKQPLIDLGVVKVLCEHAHSLDAELRHNAMWALKHLVLEVDNDLKKRCLEELESGWLVHIICDDEEDDALFARLKRERLMRDDDDDDEDMDHGDENFDDSLREWLWPALYRTKSARSASQDAQSPRVVKAERKLAALREAELNPVRKARNDDLAIQEQGLNFIRNLIGSPTSAGSGSETSQALTEMVDYLFNELGQDRLFEILASKLRVKVLHAFDRRYSGGRESRVLYPQARVIEAVVCILVHMAASIPRHRQLVIAQTELLKLLGGHFNSKDNAVRLALCHLLTNLVWKDDQADAAACAQRALELKRLGFQTKLEGLEHDDGELDIRERARTAVWSMNQSHQH